MIVETDDFFCHQLIEPHARVALPDPSWAERAFFTFCDPDRFGIDIGMSLYPNSDVLESYAIVALPGRQLSLRAARDLAGGRWPPAAGPVRMDVLEPLRRWRLVCEENEGGIAFDLEFSARAAGYECRSPRIHKAGELVYDNVNVFQTGRYSGVLRADGETFELAGRPGHRDRTWGVRASGEGRIRRGLLVWLDAELADVAVMALLHERHDGTVVRLAGAVSREGGDPVEVVELEHDLSFDYESRQLAGARFRLRDAGGESWEVEAEPRLRLFLAGGGYTSDERRRGRLGTPFWSERWDTDDPELVRRVDGLNDNLCVMRCGGRVGHGTVETLIGEHDRYRVAPLPD